MFKSQMDWVKAQLLKKGSITRNQALQRCISRLGARINDLKNAGWKIEVRWIKTRYGRDYEYVLELSHSDGQFFHRIEKVSTCESGLQFIAI